MKTTPQPPVELLPKERAEAVRQASADAMMLRLLLAATVGGLHGGMLHLSHEEVGAAGLSRSVTLETTETGVVVRVQS